MGSSDACVRNGRRIDDKVVVVSGGNSGVGFATAKGIAEAGATVAISDRNAETLADARRSLPGNATAAEAPILEAKIPVVATKRELDLLKAIVDKAAQAVFAERDKTVEYLVGTMIELPRAALETGESFWFGTNDLTQTTLGVSRDDAARFLGANVEQGIYPKHPSLGLGIEGVGELVELAAEPGRKTRPVIRPGICGEHGGDPPSIAFCEKVDLGYVSASPYRVPIARLAAAQAALQRR